MIEPTDETTNTQINTSGGANIEGNVQAQEVVGRDKHVITTGDRGVAAEQISESIVVTGNNNVIGDGNIVDNSHTVIVQRLDPTDARNQRNHKMLRQMVRSFWVDGVLKHSLYKEVLIRLNLEEHPDAVDNRPWDLILQQPGQPDYNLPAGIPIIDVFDQMNQLLLILGEPGSGKTTMLLELSDALLKRAEADPTHPTPVVFNLSSWAEKRQPLAEWLIDELRTKYNIPKKVAQKWIEDDELLPLLDGLDEVRQEQRNACTEAINEFRQQHLVLMTVCSRVAEYEDLTTQLKLQGAVLVQPLTLQQIDDYLNMAGTELSAIRSTLRDDIKLEGLATSPLMLSIMALAYHGMLAAELSLTGLPYSRRQHLFGAYVKRMFVHRENRHFYPVQKTLRWLSWLAANMVQRKQTMFLIEQLQPDWLQAYSLIWLYGVIAGLSIWVSIGLIGGLIIALTGEFPGGLTSGLIVGLLVGLFVGLRGKQRNIELVRQLEFDRKGLIVGLSFGLTVGLSIGLIDGLRSGLISGLVGGLSAGLSFALVEGLRGGLKSREVSQTTYPNQGIWQSARNALFVGLSVGLSGGVIVWFSGGRSSDLIGVLIVGLCEFGGVACILHLVLRTFLWRYNYAPFNYFHFLDYCVDHIFLHKVGGGYIFIHRMIMEHFASLTDEDIERIAASVEAKK